MVSVLIRFWNLSTFISTLKSKLYEKTQRYANGT